MHESPLILLYTNPLFLETTSYSYTSYLPPLRSAHSLYAVCFLSNGLLSFKRLKEPAIVSSLDFNPTLPRPLQTSVPSTTRRPSALCSVLAAGGDAASHNAGNCLRILNMATRLMSFSAAPIHSSMCGSTFNSIGRFSAILLWVLTSLLK